MCPTGGGLKVMPEAVLEAPTTGAPSKMVSVGEAFKNGDMDGFIERMLGAPEKIGRSSLPAEDDELAEEAEPKSDKGGEEEDSVASPEGQEAEGEQEDGQERVAEEAKVEPKESDDDELPANIQKAIDKRIGREVEKTKLLRAELEATKAELEAAKVGKTEAAPVKAVDRMSTPELEAVRAEIGQLSGLRAWCLENPDGGEVAGPDGKPRYYEAKDIRLIAANVQDKLADLKAEERITVREIKQQHAQQLAQFNQLADAEFPWLKDKASDEFGMFNQVMAAMPELAGLPNGRLAAAVHVLGLQEFQKRQAAKVKPTAAQAARATVAKIPTGQPGKPVAAGVASGEKRGTTKDRAVADAAARLRKNPGDPEALTELLGKQRVW